MSNKIWRAGVLWDVEETDHRRRYTSRDDYAEVVIDENFVSHPDQLDRDTIKVNVSTRFYRSVGTKFDVRETSVRDAVMWCMGARVALRAMVPMEGD